MLKKSTFYDMGEKLNIIMVDNYHEGKMYLLN